VNKLVRVLSLVIFTGAGSHGETDPSRGGFLTAAIDSADQGVYGAGWLSGVGSEISYGGWNLFWENSGDNSHAGHYLALTHENKRLESFSDKRAFALFANGPGFEEAVAQRKFNAKLIDGDVFSVCLHAERMGGFSRDSSTPGAVGVILSTEESISSCGEYNKGAVVEFGAFSGKENYMIYDGDGEYDTGYSVKNSPISVSFEFLGGGKYRAQIAKIGENIGDILEVVDCPERTLRGVKRADDIRGMVFFNRNGDLNDFYFNDIVIDRYADY
jgi:hypothetical protein